jgi:hypothetical protein
MPAEGLRDVAKHFSSLRTDNALLVQIAICIHNLEFLNLFAGTRAFKSTPGFHRLSNLSARGKGIILGLESSVHPRLEGQSRANPDFLIAHWRYLSCDVTKSYLEALQNDV